MTDRAYFISDLHLGSSTEPNSLVLIKFLGSFHGLDQITHLFLLGDIFDLWIANHDYFKKKYAPIVNELIRLRNIGVKIHYFEGNHDLYLEHFFGHELGFKIYRKADNFLILGYRVRVEHGDQMNPYDYGYRFLRWFLRTYLMEWLAPRLPEWCVVWLGQRMSKVSRRYTSKMKAISEENTQKVIHKHAKRVWRKNPFDIMVSGHMHMLFDTKLLVGEETVGEIARVVNLGAWFDRARVFTITSGLIGFRDLN
ncbi:MAG: hypothetical protein A2Z20_09915 [Bdellovibrionales bacterium RBG_16_40_8]|nr:MAG: hypothetical protein A2Z20_09915 [Bdellovibrionales bacterium RBG_16_40_8]